MVVEVAALVEADAVDRQVLRRNRLRLQLNAEMLLLRYRDLLLGDRLRGKLHREAQMRRAEVSRRRLRRPIQSFSFTR